MYLKQTSIGPLGDGDIGEWIKFLSSLREKGQLPGWSKDDKGSLYPDPYSTSDTVDCRKHGDSFVYHYTITWRLKEGPWRLQKAWRTDQNDRIVEEYRVP